MSSNNNSSFSKNNESSKLKYPVSELNIALKKAYKTHNPNKLMRILKLIKPTDDEILRLITDGYYWGYNIADIQSLKIVLQYLGKTKSKLLLKYRYKSNIDENGRLILSITEILLYIVAFVTVFKSKINLPLIDLIPDYADRRLYPLFKNLEISELDLIIQSSKMKLYIFLRVIFHKYKHQILAFELINKYYTRDELMENDNIELLLYIALSSNNESLILHLLDNKYITYDDITRSLKLGHINVKILLKVNPKIHDLNSFCGIWLIRRCTIFNALFEVSDNIVRHRLINFSIMINQKQSLQAIGDIIKMPHIPLYIYNNRTIDIQNWKASIIKIFIKDKNLTSLCKKYKRDMSYPQFIGHIN